VDVKPADRSDRSVPKEVVDLLIALLMGDRSIALTRRGMGTRREDPRPRVEHRAPHRTKRSHRVPSRVVDVRDQLDLTGVQLPHDLPLDLAEPLEHRRRAVRLTPGERVDQEQLLLDPDRERLTGAEAVIAIMLHGHVGSMPRSRWARTHRWLDQAASAVTWPPGCDLTTDELGPTSRAA
jgi:hypothetical protein